MCAKVSKSNVVVICGPTATGKTVVAIDLAATFDAEIVSADSMQVYRHMDIGTAKPTPNEQAAVPHHMIDIIDPDEHLDARQYSRMAGEKITGLHARGITPFVVGGTGFYIKALLYGLFEGGPSDSGIRQRLKEEAGDRGNGFLHSRLEKCDPEAAGRLHPNDTYRVIRALEVYELTGEPISRYHREHRFAERPFNVLKIGLNLNRDILYDRINLRVDAMVAAGLLDEVKGLLDRGYAGDLKSMQSIGYRHMVGCINGKYPWDEILRTLKRDTRRYAKRQLTWFKSDPEILWSEPENVNDMRRKIKKFLQHETDNK
jgi:tRNA dimethylallyltransferase